MGGPILGRAGELDDLFAFLADKTQTARAIVLCGEAGIGKTTIWRAGLRRAEERDLRMLVAQPAKSQTGLPYAALADLFATVTDDVFRLLLPQQRAAVSAALARTESTGPLDQHALARGTVELLSALASGGHLLVAIDDVQWLDGPVNVAVDATGPTGAQVTYPASARDDRDQSPSLVCTPASGSTFAIGDTVVACTATDAAGNAATARFTVHVRGASEQIVRLIDETLAFLDLPALKPTLEAALKSAVDSSLAKNPRLTCQLLSVYIAAVKTAPTRAFTPAERSQLIADAGRIRAVIGC